MKPLSFFPTSCNCHIWKQTNEMLMKGSGNLYFLAEKSHISALGLPGGDSNQCTCNKLSQGSNFKLLLAPQLSPASHLSPASSFKQYSFPNRFQRWPRSGNLSTNSNNCQVTKDYPVSKDPNGSLSPICCRRIPSQVRNSFSQTTWGKEFSLTLDHQNHKELSSTRVSFFQGNF